MIGFIKIFLLGWGSILAFWAAALFFCFIGTEVGFKYWKRKLVIGLPFFLLFYFLVHAFGVPKYFVYDHVEPKLLNGQSYYPAVKNHIIFQGPSFKTYGVISEDLEDFKSEETYFSAFGVSAREDYPSVVGIKSWINEIILISYFLLWYIFINKLHNASAATALYKEARKENRLEQYQSYLNASQAIRFLQPFKRRNARREFHKIRQVYIQYLETMLLKLANQANESSRPVLLYLADQLRTSVEWYPTVTAQGHIEDLTTTPDIEAHEKGVEFDRRYFKPTDNELSDALGSSVAKTLNQFLPEALLKGTSSSETSTVALNCKLRCRIADSSQLKKGDGRASLVLVWGDVNQHPSGKNLIFQDKLYTYPPTFKEGKSEASRKFCANQIAQSVTNNVLFPNTQKVNIQEGDDKKIQAKLKEIEARQSRVFDAIIDECKSTARDAVLAETISYALKNNEVLVDRAMSEMHQLLAENTNLYAQIIAQEAIGGLLEGVVEAASE